MFKKTCYCFGFKDFLESYWVDPVCGYCKCELCICWWTCINCCFFLSCSQCYLPATLIEDTKDLWKEIDMVQEKVILLVCECFAYIFFKHNFCSFLFFFWDKSNYGTSKGSKFIGQQPIVETILSTSYADWVRHSRCFIFF